MPWETSHAYVVTSIRRNFVDGFFGRVSNWLTGVRQRLLARKSGMERVIFDHHGRFEQLFRMLLWRPPVASDRALEELVAVIPGGDAIWMRMFPYRAVYGAAVRYLRGAPATRRAAEVIRRHASILGLTPEGSPLATAEAIRAHRGPERDHDDFRHDVDPGELPGHLRALAPLARTR